MTADSKISPQDSDALAEALLGLESIEEVKAFLDDLCTPSELRAFAERFKVARLLDAGQRTGASTTTVTRVARFLREMPHQGYRLVLDKLKTK